ncbi:MAG: antibiotic ABC transporter ATP-binding protein [Candidatus Muiribacterium halophilum]|uniref:Antibiotic ABC transporter ATP-binding protein n=1 Tax=Muiribacterium halophilum TaxID=2053465 RepID=A0A2N5ZAT3_MUIH1|nr:MAG: antibiotic ABC transporter ATP-binding protein [Candidatus Muirbacterium halophilum]
MKDILVFIGVFVMMFLINKELSIMILLIIPLLIILTYFYQRTMRDAYRIVRKQIAKMNAFLSENFSGMFVIKAFNKENKGLQMFAENNNNMFAAQKKQVVLMSTFMPVINVLRFLSMAIILVYGGRKILRGQMMFGDMVAFFSYVEMFFRPIRSMAQKFNVLQSAQAALERVFTVLSDKKNDEYLGGDEKLEFKDSIIFDNVSFEYKKDKQVLKDVSFRINAGEKVAFVGHTGAGKTTIINLITQFYKNKKGKILIDDIDIREYDRDSLRANLAYVPQDVFIFSESIYYNIAFEERSVKRIDSIIEELQIEQFLNRQVNGLETEMLERGNSLSYGEKQLLAFARALYTDPQIIVLDEATSNIDSHTEDMIQGALERLLEGRTALIIAHRLSTIKNCDRIFVMNKGRIVESGKHDELLSKKGYYFKLYQYQSFN